MEGYPPPGFRGTYTAPMPNDELEPALPTDPNRTSLIIISDFI